MRTATPRPFGPFSVPPLGVFIAILLLIGGLWGFVWLLQFTQQFKGF